MRPFPREAGARLSRRLAGAQRLFNAGLYFETHECLEADWKKTSGPWKICLQGLVQVAAGFHKLKIGPPGRAGALYLLGRGLQKLKASRELLGEDVLAEIESTLRPVLAAIGAGKSFEAPRLCWIKDGGSGR